MARVAEYAWILAPILCSACARPAEGAAPPLTAVDREDSDWNEFVRGASWTVAVFTSANCGCFKAHDNRLRDVASAFGPRGVQFVGIDSEEGATAETVLEEARSHGLPFPIWVDREAKLARRFGAEYATYTVLLDQEGRVRYRGGIDSDKSKLHDDAVPYLRDAIEDVLAGRDVRRPEGKTLGCVLRRW